MGARDEHQFLVWSVLAAMLSSISVTISTEHLIDDWHSVEYTIGGKRSVLGSDQTVLLHNNVNKASEQESKSKYLSEE